MYICTEGFSVMTAYLPSPTDIVSNVIATLVVNALIASSVYAVARFTSIAGKFSLRTRITSANIVMTVASLALIRIGANAYFTIALLGITVMAVTQYVLKDLSHVGIVNSFRSTETGLKPDKSLKLVTKNFDFLGIGANKLSKSDEFRKAIERCRNSGGKIRFLLSTPKNSALASLAQKNDKDSQAYSARVRESIRQILHQNNKHGANTVEIRLYELSSAFALPHFRLMFIDSKICLFSHLVWNDREGMDNPQLLIRKKHLGAEAESLYSAYQKYFDDLWDSPETKLIADPDDPRLAL
jgi:hypothetical protein